MFRRARGPWWGEGRGWLGFWGGVVSLGIGGLILWTRLAGLEGWSEEGGPYRVGDHWILTGYDAYHFLAEAREWGREPVGERQVPDPRRFYPEYLYGEGEFRGDWRGYGPSVWVGSLAAATGKSVDGWAFWSPVVWAFLVPVPLVFFFWRLGFPLVGVGAGVVGMLTVEALARVAAGRLDTDAGLLFFPAVAACFLGGLYGRGSFWRAALVAAVGGGLAAWALDAWYGKVALSFLVGIGLAGVLVGRVVREARERERAVGKGRSAIRLLVPLAVFVVFLGPSAWERAVGEVVEFFEVRVVPGGEGAGLVVESAEEEHAGAVEGVYDPSGAVVWETVQEARKLQGWRDWSERLGGGPWLLGLALVGTAALLLLQPWLLAPWVGYVVLGSLAVAEGQRFVLFLGPVLGMGLGYALHLGWGGFREVRSRWGRKGEGAAREARSWRGLRMALGAWLVGVLLVLGWAGPPGTWTGPQPVLHPEVVRGLEEWERDRPQDAVLVSWWDLGYGLRERTGRAIAIDGGTQFSSRARLLATALASRVRPLPAIVALAYARLGNARTEAIAKRAGMSWASVPQWREALEKMGPDGSARPVYLLFSTDLYAKLPSLWWVGTRQDPVLGARVPAFDLLEVVAADRQTLRIKVREQGERAGVSPAEVDLRRGTWEEGRGLRRVVLIRDGEVFAEEDFQRWGRPSLLVLFRGNEIFSAVRVSEPLFHSNFVQWFLLGRAPPGWVAEDWVRFPYLRAYRVEMEKR